MKQIKNTLYFSILLFIVLCNYSCRKELDVNYDRKKKLVVNSLFAVDSIITINLSTTYSSHTDNVDLEINDTNTIPYVKNAEVILLKEGQRLDTLEYIGAGFYKSEYRAQPKTNYSIRVITSQFNTVTASSYVPQHISILSTKKRNDSAIISFKDPSEQTNYYYVFIGSNNPEGFYVIFNKDVRNLHTGEKYTRGFFSDEMFNGDTCEVSIKNPTYYNTTEKHVYLCHINKDYYKYSQLEDEQRNLELIGDQFFLAFAEPINVYSNISKGLGIFTGFSLSKDTVYFYPDISVDTSEIPDRLK